MNLPTLLAEDPTDLASASLLVIRLRDAVRELMKELDAYRDESALYQKAHERACIGWTADEERFEKQIAAHLSELARVDGLLARERAERHRDLETIARHEAFMNQSRQLEAVSKAAQRRERESTIAFLLDRAGQYPNSSGYVACIDELVLGIADGRHVECCAAGEYADLYPRVQRIMQRTDAKESANG